ASENLVLALRYGAAPLQESVYSEALAYQKLLANQVGDLELRCEQPDVHLALDGQALAACPTVQTRRVAPGHHLVVATRAGYLTRTVDVVVIGGKREARTLTLVPMSTTARITHPWQTWKPWAVFAAGAGVAAFGGLLQIRATTEMARYDRAVTRACSL